MMFVVFGLILSASVGGFVGMILTSGIRNKVINTITTIILALVIGFGLTSLLMWERKVNEQMFNNGYCECGGEWDLFDIEYRKNSGSLYFYKCEECKNVIKLNSEF